MRTIPRSQATAILIGVIEILVRSPVCVFLLKFGLVLMTFQVNVPINHQEKSSLSLPSLPTRLLLATYPLTVPKETSRASLDQRYLSAFSIFCAALFRCRQNPRKSSETAMKSLKASAMSNLKILTP